jgi:cytochrome P450
MLFRMLRLMVHLGWPFRMISPLFGPFNPFLPSYRTDPYPHYRALREHHPAYVSRMFRALVLSRHADITRILKDPRFSVNRAQLLDAPAIVNPFAGMQPEFREAVLSSLLMTDPPSHTRIRSLVNKAFTPRRIELLRPRIQAIVDELLDALPVGSEIDLMHDFAEPLPITVIAELLGVPARDRMRFKSWSTVLGTLLDPVASEFGLRELEVAFSDMTAYFNSLFEERRREPRDDLMSALVAAEESGDRLSSAELLSVCALILGAGHETTTNLLGNAVVALLRNPGERKRLSEDPSLIDTAVEEFLRYDSPVQVTDRIARESCIIEGYELKAESPVLLLLGAGNRDPKVFQDPDRLDLGRSDNRHLSFSQGAHYCLGAQLARAEAQIALNSLLARYPDFRGNPDPPSWRSSLVLRGPATLPLHL